MIGAVARSEVILQIKTMTRSKTTVAATASVTNAKPAASRTFSMVRSMHSAALFDIVENT